MLYVLIYRCAECDTHCILCNVNGPGKCDSNMCVAGYVYAASTKNCLRESSFDLITVL